MTCNCEPVGAADIAKRLGLARNTIVIYRLQGQLPKERWTVSGRPVWCWQEDIEPWAAERRFYKKSEEQVES